MAASAQKRATYEDVLAAPENCIAEFIDGVLYTQPRPALPHALVSSVLGAELGPPFSRGRGGPGGWILLHEPLARTLDVLRLENGRWVLLATFAADARVRAESFDSVELELGALWADLAEEKRAE